MHTLKDKVIVITGSSRGIGLATALRVAKEGAKVVIIGKTDSPHAKLDGTIYTAAEAVNAAGGEALAIKMDLRYPEEIEAGFETIADHFGRIDALINNASAINLSPVENITCKQYDLMHSINGRGSFLCAQHAIPLLKKADNPHILNDSPPFELLNDYFAQMGSAYVGAKYLMSIWTQTMSLELKPYGIAVNSIWPTRPIATAAVKNILPHFLSGSRKPEIVAEATYHIITQDATAGTGQFYTDEGILQSVGINDLSIYETAY